MLSTPVVIKVRYFQYHNWRHYISHSYMNHQVPEVSSEELLLSRPIRCELSRLCCHGHSLLLSSYLHRISRKENSACSACGHPLRNLNHLLDCLASEPLRKSIFGFSLSLFLTYGPDLGVWPNCWVSAEFLHAPIPRKRSGSTSTTTFVQCKSMLSRGVSIKAAVVLHSNLQRGLYFRFKAGRFRSYAWGRPCLFEPHRSLEGAAQKVTETVSYTRLQPGDKKH